MNERPIDPRNLRPYTAELLLTCSEQTTCHHCPMRQGCPERYKFYVNDDIEFETTLQKSEIIAAKIFGETRAFDAAQHLRNKRICEMRDNPVYSFK